MTETLNTCRTIMSDLDRAVGKAAKELLETLRPMCQTYGAAQTELNKLAREARFAKRDIAALVLAHALGLLEIEKMRQPFVPPVEVPRHAPDTTDE